MSDMSDKGAEFLKQLPHSYPMKLVDRILELNKDYVKAVKNVTINEPFFPGHFPDMPLMPGVLVIEAMAQVSIILSMNVYGGGGDDDDMLYLLTGIDKARFKRRVVPGDRLILEARCIRNKGNYYSFETTASVDGELVASAQLKSMSKKV